MDRCAGELGPWCHDSPGPSGGSKKSRRRKSIDEETLNQALARLDENAVLAEDRAIVLSSEGWHQGVIGIVASRLVEKHHLPTVMIAVDNGVGKGSARSIPGFHLCEALKECEDTLLRYGGHKYAAGLVIDPKQIPAFTEKFKQVSQKMMDDEAFVRKTFIDAELELNQINNELLDALEAFSPYGPQNTQPIFMTRGCEIVGMPMKVGRNHLRMRVRKGDTSIDTIGFGLGDYAEPLQLDNSPIDVVYAAEYNVWNGKKRIQLHMKDVRFSSDSLNSGHILAGAAISG
ncbi:MAG: hypothetical protein IIB00_04580 [candidate division Zixibacteria bacterium]|nr:hypothetical protein [candidate division Zixibacteria bacterium]